MRLSRLLTTAVTGCALAFGSVPVGAASGAPRSETGSGTETETYEVHYVPTVGDAVIRVEIWRDTAFDESGQPVIFTYSPYNSLGEPEPARDSVGERYVPEGYARAVADVLGTRGSTGCWDYGGAAETRSGVDVVHWLADQEWSSGKVAMIGGSYNGTTASMVAARGAEVPELKAIVPISAISRWYGYAYGDGTRYFLNSEVPTDEGFDTPLAFDVGFGKTVAADPMGQHFADTARSRAGECDATAHTEEGYSRNPDYDRFWVQRDYRRRAEDFRAAVLLAHGWQDYNVKQQEATELFRALPVDDSSTQRVEGVPFKLMYLTQGSHSGGTDGRRWLPLLDRFLAHTLKGAVNGIQGAGPVITRGASSTGPTRFRVHGDYPLRSTVPTTLWLRRDAESGVLGSRPDRRGRTNTGSYVETGTSTEEAGTLGGLEYRSAALTRATRLVGSARLHAVVRMQRSTMHLTPVLVDIAPAGSARTVERGFLHVDYRNGLDHADPAPGSWVRATVRMLPQDYTFAAGHRVGLWLRSSNTVWAVPGNPGAVDVAEGRVGAVTATGSRLVLPTVGRPALLDRR